MWWQWLLTILGGIVGGLALGYIGNWIEGSGPRARDLQWLRHSNPYDQHDRS